MIIKTNEPITGSSNKILSEISRFWDNISQGWRAVLGHHIHHGYYEFDDKISPVEAQEKLLDKLCELLHIQGGNTILDVGCGIGGSSRFLASEHGVDIVAITLSKNQLKIAEDETPISLIPKISYKIVDAHDLSCFPSDHFDIVWSLESCEQFYDKALFINEALRVLKQGGQLMIATWCSDQETYEGAQATHYLKLCKNFQLPYMPTMECYSNMLRDKGKLLYVQDWTPYVKNSWDIGIEHLRQFSWIKLLRLGGLTGLCFVKNLKSMSQAFQSGQLRYGVFVVCKN